MPDLPPTACPVCLAERRRVPMPSRDGYYVRASTAFDHDAGTLPGWMVVEYGLPPYHDKVVFTGLSEHAARWTMTELIAGRSLPTPEAQDASERRFHRGRV